MNKFFPKVFGFALLGILSSIIFWLGALNAQQPMFKDVIPFGITAGTFGFFNQGTGELFIYTEDLKTCLFQGQLNELGQPGTVINVQPMKKPGVY